MKPTLDDNTWLEQIRCPKFFDFEAALTIPCPNDSHTNPPLRDSVYDSDEETRSFFRSLDADPSLHHTPNEQPVSPVPADLRQIRPVYRHRPTTAFEDYLRVFRESHHAALSPQTDLSQPSPETTPPRTRQRTPPTAVRTPLRPASRTPRKEPVSTTPLKTELKTPTLESIQTPTSLRRRLATPSRPKQQVSPDTARQSAPKDRAPVRRPRPPERVTPPLSGSSSFASTSTGGTTTRPKSRPAIARPEVVERRTGLPMRAERCAASSEHGNQVSPSSSGLSPEQCETESQSKAESATEEDLPAPDPDILRMMEEHNRRVRRKQSRSDGDTKKVMFDSENAEADSKCDSRRNTTLEHRRRRSARTATGQQGRRAVSTRVRSLNEPLRREASDVFWDDDGGERRAKRNTFGAKQMIKQGVKPLQPDTERNSAVDEEVSVSITGQTDTEPSLDELLKSENDRILEERRKKLPERRKALQADRTSVLKSLKGQIATQHRSSASVEFTAANASAKARALRQTVSSTGSPSTRAKENRIARSSRDAPNSQQTRGLQGFRERSRITPTSSSAPKSAGSRQTSAWNAAGFRRAQPFTEKIKASERQKRLEKRMESDLQSLLSQHNSRVQGNRRGYTSRQ